MPANELLPPIYVKRRKKHHDDHTHGAWKVAFADFAIAMMAFFLLMWLLNQATQEERREVAGYFERPEDYTPTSDSTPIIVILNDQIEVDSEKLLTKEDVGLIREEDLKEIIAKREEQKMQKLKQLVELKIEQTASLKKFKDQIYLDITKQGLRIQIFDNENKAMFAKSSSLLEADANVILTNLSEPLSKVKNRISVTGHTDTSSFNKPGFTNWELSAERANAARRALVEGGLREKKVAQVIGLASTALLDRENPESPLNRRISILVLNQEADEALRQREAELNEKATAEILGQELTTEEKAQDATEPEPKTEAEATETVEASEPESQIEEEPEPEAETIDQELESEELAVEPEVEDDSAAQLEPDEGADAIEEVEKPTIDDLVDDFGLEILR